MHPELTQELFHSNATLLSPKFLQNRKWSLNQCAFPVLDVTFNGTRPLRVVLTCDEWDDFPPSAELLEIDGSPITGLETIGGIFNNGPHPVTNKPFICMRGFREYHTHSGHLNDYWDGYKGKDGMNLPGLLDQLSTAWRKAIGE